MLAQLCGLFTKPCASQSLFGGLTAEIFLHRLSLYGGPIISLFVLAVLPKFVLLFEEGGGLGGIAASTCLLDYRLEGND